jgi:DHA2 family multidrug resistance protein
VAGCALGFTLGVTLLGTLVTLPQYAQGPLGFTATLSGALIAVRALPVMLLTPVAARLAGNGRIDPRLQIGLGFVAIGISNLLLANVTTPTADFGAFTGSLLLAGFGLSQVFVPLSIVVFGSVEPRDIPKASAMFNLARQLGGSVATAILITLLDRSAVTHQTRLAAEITARRPPVVAFFAHRGGLASPAATAQLNGIVGLQAEVLGYADTNRDSAIVTLVLAPFVLLLRRPKRPVAAAAD